MPTTQAELRSLLIELSRSAEADLATIWKQLPPDVTYEAMMDVLPSLVGDYGDAAATVTAEWYDEHRDDLNISGRFAADVPVNPSLGAEALAGWGAKLAQSNYATALPLISGGLVKRVMNSGRDTLMVNVDRDPQARGWQRAGSGDCGFCRMLISRGAVYTRSSVNFGAHDNCKCVAVPAFGGRALPVKAYTPSARDIPDADKERAKKWIAENVDSSSAPQVNRRAVRTAIVPERDVVRTVPARKVSERDGRRLGRETWFDYADNVAPDDAALVRVYTGNGYEELNGALRDRDLSYLTSTKRDAITTLDRVIDDAPRVPENITVSRAVSAKVYGLDKPGAQLESVIGKPFRDDAFLSTAYQSKLAGIDRHEVELRLDVPAGTRALYVSGHPSRDPKGLAAFGPEENELIVGRGIDYEFTDVLMDGNRRVLVGRIIGQDGGRGGQPE